MPCGDDDMRYIRCPITSMDPTHSEIMAKALLDPQPHKLLMPFASYRAQDDHIIEALEKIRQSNGIERVMRFDQAHQRCGRTMLLWRVAKRASERGWHIALWEGADDAGTHLRSHPHSVEG